LATTSNATATSAPHVDAPGGVDGVGAQDQLGGSTADVGDEIRRGETGREASCGTREREARLLVTRDHLGLHAQEPFDAGHELVAVGGVAGGTGRHHPDPVHAELVDQPGVARQGRQRPVQGFGCESAGPIHALTEPDDLQPAVQVALVAVDVEVGHQQPERIRAAVDGRDAGHPTSAQGPPAHQSGNASSASSPSELTPRPAASA
jgi:hypothetical protein